jgi:two-component system OmpR family sensor kinase
VNIGLRLRATLWSVGANGLVLLLGTALMFWLLDQQLTGALDETLTAQARATSAAVETWIAEELRDESAPATAETVRALLYSSKLNQGLKGLFTAPTDAPTSTPTMTSLLDSQGAVLMSTHSPTVLEPPSPDVLQAARGGGVHRAIAKIVSQEKESAFRVATVPVSAGGRVAAFVQVWGPLQPIRGTLNRVRTLLAFSFAALLLLNSWLVGVTLRRAFRPVNALVAEIHKITERNLSVRVPVPAARDEMRRLSQTFNDMLDRLDRGFQFQTRLFQDLSHQLKTPLAILTGTLETSLVRGRTVKEYRTILESSLDEVGRMTQLIEHLLLLARLDSQQLVLQTIPMDLGDFCRSWVDDFALLLDTKDLKAQWHDAGRLPVSIDPARLGQALLNLLDNAVKHSPQGSRLVFRLFRTNTAAGLDLINFGPRFTPGSEERIFQRFFRETDGSAGFGLGLPIARAAVELHGGRLTAFSPPDGGAAFRLELPLAGIPPSNGPR